MSDSAIHRPLVITSPHHMHGGDVEALQKAIDNLSTADHYALPRIPIDGDFGLATLGHYKDGGARGVGYYAGLADVYLGHGEPLQEHAQAVIRGLGSGAPDVRTPTERVRGKRRYIERRRYLADHRGAEVALAWAHSQIGNVEHPAGSNEGPEVSAYQRNFGVNGVPWCGAFVGTAMIRGGLHPSARILYVPYIATDYPRVAWSRRKAGDLCCFNFGAGLQHVGMLDRDLSHTIEGNTSSGNSGSQDNGGGVFRRQRDPGTVAVLVRPPWPS